MFCDKRLCERFSRSIGHAFSSSVLCVRVSIRTRFVGTVNVEMADQVDTADTWDITNEHGINY